MKDGNRCTVKVLDGGQPLALCRDLQIHPGHALGDGGLVEGKSRLPAAEVCRQAHGPRKCVPVMVVRMPSAPNSSGGLATPSTSTATCFPAPQGRGIAGHSPTVPAASRSINAVHIVPGPAKDIAAESQWVFVAQRFTSLSMTGQGSGA